MFSTLYSDLGMQNNIEKAVESTVELKDVDVHECAVVQIDQNPMLAFNQSLQFINKFLLLPVPSLGLILCSFHWLLLRGKTFLHLPEEGTCIEEGVVYFIVLAEGYHWLNVVIG